MQNWVYNIRKTLQIVLEVGGEPVLYRKMYDKMISWKNNKSRKALLITGARQTGKTFLIREFGRQNYENFVEINFITEPRAASIFTKFS